MRVSVLMPWCKSFRERSDMTSARFWHILPPPPPSPLSATVSIERAPDDVSICQTPPPPFQSDISFSKNPLHRTYTN